MSSSPEPLCPNCGRRIAAWKMNHCVYCGATFPPDFKQGFAEPEALKWVERPAIPPEAAKQLEMLKVVRLDAAKKPRSLLLALGLLSVPVFAVLFYLLFALVRRYSAALAPLILLAGAGFLAYLVWTLKKATTL
ncbi:MAG TPA: hypothetical protein VER78_06525 [Thermoanaerobaculia bacterium]|nr:hypothetical protein [Thermoanaerobaculia bacterium]